MSDMEYRKFSTFIDSVQYGYTADETSPIEGDAKYLRITDIVPYFVDKDRVPFCKIENNKKTKYLVSENDLLIARTGATTGYNLIVPKGFENYIFASYLVRFNYRKNELYPKFLKHVLKSQQYYGFVKNFIGGSAQPGMNPKAFGKFEVPYMEYDAQKRIADILSTYDDMIENNNRRIALLEKAAQELYKEWFVRFRFPGHETIKVVESRLGKIPSSFNIIKMNEAFDYYIGGGWGNDEYSADFTEEAYVIRGTDFPNVQKGNLSTCPLRYHKKSNYSARELRENDIIIEVSGGTAEQPVGRTLLVTKDVIDRLGGKVICASFCKQIRLNTEVVTPYYFYYWMQFLYDTRIIDRFQLQSTGIINFKFEYFLRKGDIMLPPRELMDKFDKNVKTLYEEIAILARQNDNLVKQRDLLLPRLMSGKLEV